MAAAILTERLIDLLGGHRTTATLCAAVELGVIDALASGKRTAAEIAVECATHEAASERLLAGLVGLEICRRCGGAHYALTEMGACLAKGADKSLRDWALFEGKILSPTWLGLSDSIRSGKTATELAGLAGGRYAEIGRHAQSASMFDAAMVSMSRLVARDVLTAYDFGTASRILDVGGGTGSLLIEILQNYPTASGSILDLSRCEPGAHRAITAAGLEARADYVVGDFFVELPAGFDTLLLKSVLHNWDDARCRTVLTNCRRALRDAGRLIIIERLLAIDDQAPSRLAATTMSDLNMLRGPGGRERSAAAYRELIADAGLTILHVRCAGRHALLIAASGEPRSEK